MALSEVGAILGDHGIECKAGWGQHDDHGYSGLKAWKSGGYAILVRFENDRVTGKSLFEKPLWDRVGAWYHGGEAEEWGALTRSDLLFH